MTLSITQGIIIDNINTLNDPFCKGIMVQLPLPKHLDKNKILYQIDEKKIWMVYI